MDRIGRVYSKVKFKRFTDATYTKEIPNPPWMGILGPLIRAEVGDAVQINFKNMATGRNYSMHPHGVIYLKNSEGSVYLDGTSGKDKEDDLVPPGDMHTYFWNITQNFAPAKDDENCVSWGYHSHKSSGKDINTGLVGLLLSCRKGILAKDGETRTDGYRDIVLLTEIFLEDSSWKYEENLKRCGDPSACKKLADEKNRDFTGSNIMYSINGYGFGNLNIDVEEGERLAVHFMGLNTGAHGISIYGQTFTYLNRRVFTLPVYPATFISTKLIPTKVGKWLIHCRVTTHFRGGMIGFLNVRKSRKYFRGPKLNGKVRHYYIAAREIAWNYGPSGKNLLTGEFLDASESDSKTFFERGPKRIGGRYRKVHYVEYTDSSFKRRKRKTGSKKHLGLLGPVIRMEVGDKVRVIFKNFASRDYSFAPNGVVFDKREEGNIHKNGGWTQQGKFAAPGKVVTYTFSAPESVAPTVDDPHCLTYTYHSGVDFVKDLNSGLIGPLLVCKKGTLTRSGEQKYVNREYHLLYVTFNENESWYLDGNIKKYTTDPKGVDKNETGFVLSNEMQGLNGFLYGNLPGLDMCIGEKISWHLIGMGSRFDVHGAHFHGNTLKILGINRDSISLLPGLSYTGKMTPDNVGTWQVICRSNIHHDSGMRALYNVKKCGRENRQRSTHDNYYRRVRVYYIAAVEIEWDYAPVKLNLVSGQSLLNPNASGHKYVRTDKGEFIGSKYKKVVYREFTDHSFSTQKVRNAEEEHLGLMGPYIKAEVSEEIKVIFKNMADRAYSIHPHGVFYDKKNEGSVYKDRSSTDNGDSVEPGNTYTYRWKVPERAAPTKGEANCKSWVYYSSVSSTKDMHTGLFGPLVVCRRGILDRNNRRRDVDHEFTVLFFVINEKESWLFEKNVKLFAPNRKDVNNTAFSESNLYFMINGFIFGNLKGVVMNIRQTIAWHVIALGSVLDFHTVHFHGQTFIHKSNAVHRGDVMEVVPGTFENLEMVTNNPGKWLFHCHVSQHMSEGMFAIYNILPDIAPRKRQRY